MRLIWKKKGGPYRVVQGGGWNSDDRYLRASYRGGSVPGSRYVNLGFRCVRKS